MSVTAVLVVAFWVQLSTLLYVYVGYPALAIGFGLLFRRPVRKTPWEPSVTIVIAAHNESGHIEANLLNKQQLDYPPEKLAIVVVSDGSADGTDQIVRRFSPRVALLRQETRRGKSAALNLALRQITSDIVVIADANSMYDTNTLRSLVNNFHDPSVGYATGRLVYHGDHAIGVGNRAYMGYESLLRSAETRLGSVVGVNGGVDAFRRELYQALRDDELPDFALPLRIVDQGFRVIYDPEARLWEEALPAGRAEYTMRVRVSLRALWTLVDMRHLLNPARGGLFSLQLLSHKVLRYAACPILIGMYMTACLLYGRGAPYRLVAAATTLLFVSGAAGMLLERRGRLSGALVLPYYYLLVTLASGHALWSLLRGRRVITWKPRLG